MNVMGDKGVRVHTEVVEVVMAALEEAEEQGGGGEDRASLLACAVEEEATCSAGGGEQRWRDRLGGGAGRVRLGLAGLAAAGDDRAQLGLPPRVVVCWRVA